MRPIDSKSELNNLSIVCLARKQMMCKLKVNENNRCITCTIPLYAMMMEFPLQIEIELYVCICRLFPILFYQLGAKILFNNKIVKSFKYI